MLLERTQGLEVTRMLGTEAGGDPGSARTTLEVPPFRISSEMPFKPPEPSPQLGCIFQNTFCASSLLRKAARKTSPEWHPGRKPLKLEEMQYLFIFLQKPKWYSSTYTASTMKSAGDSWLS